MEEVNEIGEVSGPRMRLRAAKGRVILKFPPAITETEKGVAIPEGSQMRLEWAKVIDVGEAVTAEDEAHRAWLLERQRKGEPVLASFESGVSYWKKNYDTKWDFLKDYRGYHLSQPSAHVEMVEQPVIERVPPIILAN